MPATVFEVIVHFVSSVFSVFGDIKWSTIEISLSLAWNKSKKECA